MGCSRVSALGCLTVVIVPLLLGLGKWGLEYNRFAAYTGETTGEIIDVRYKPAYNRKGSHSYTTVQYRYVVNGQTLEVATQRDGAFQTTFSANTPARICYIPAQPRLSLPVPGNRGCPPRSKPWEAQNEPWRVRRP